jgi:diaminohydroxyphosphoribosylaminopyrimidine deaminase/5-amino-6-(5-phosphoribosylamino)uracil reductase
VLDSQARLSPESKLAQTAREVPVLLAVEADAPSDSCQNLERLGVEILRASGTPAERLGAVLDELGSREYTNVLVEGGAAVLGALLDLDEIDEVHAFIAPKLIGGAGPAALAGKGIAAMESALRLESLQVEQLGDDVYVQGRIAR